MGIKHHPDEFKVDEVLSPDVAVRGAATPFGLYRLTKSGLDTLVALQLVARALRLPTESVAAGGLKDRHARTTQHISVALAPEHKGGPARLSGDGWEIERLGYLDKPLTSAAIAGNRFGIVVRSLERRDVDTMNRAARLLAPVQTGVAGRGQGPPAAVRVVNYFGAQRFGSARHGEGFLAKNLIRGDFEGALKLAIATPDRKDNRRIKEFRRAVSRGWGDWPRLARELPRHPHRAAVELLARNNGDFRGAFQALPYFLQQISVEAYQSFLWNSVARLLIQKRCAGRVIVAPDPYGEMWFPNADQTPADLIDLDLPLLGPRTPWVEPWKPCAELVFQREGLVPRDLVVPGLRRPFFGESPRRLLISATEFQMRNPHPDDDAPQGEEPKFKRFISFTLPRGAYATVVLRALGM